MRDRRMRLALAVVAAGVVAAGAAIAAGSSGREAAIPVAPTAKGDGEMPSALQRHLQQRANTIPGNGGEPGESSLEKSSAAMQDFIELAYPKKDIPLSSIEAARKAIAAAEARSPGRRRGVWRQVGPQTAIYPFTPLRTAADYVPNEYAAGGRTTDLAIDPNCGIPSHRCRMWITPAGGGVWRTMNALAPHPKWEYLSDSFGINSIGSITIDPNDPSADTLWVGTGEGNTCGSGCVAGVGLYKSTDGGDHWTGPIGQSAFNARGVGTIAIKPGSPNTILAGSGFGVRGHASSCCYGAVSPYRALIPGAPIWGLYRSTNGGSTWTLVHNGSTDPTACGTDPLPIANNTTPCSPRGVRRVFFDPSNANIVYAASYARGVWRSSDSGSTWTQIKPSLNSAIATTRPDIAVTRLPNGNTRMYVGEGNVCPPQPCDFSRLSRSDNVATGAPVFTQLTSNDPNTPQWHSFNFCTGQCWYDNFVYTPPGHPDVLYSGGSYLYGENVANHRGVLRSTNAGATFTDVTYDGTDVVHPNGIHPDQHRLVTNPRDPGQFFEASDGGLMRSSGDYVNRSANCDSRGLAEPFLTRCHELLSAVPSKLSSMNRGLPTLQFQSLSVSPFDNEELQGGTQDNGTWENFGSEKTWYQTMVGDGGQSGFDATDPDFRFHTFFDAQPDVNFSGGEIADWNWIGDLTAGGPGNLFYIPIISDPVVHRTMFAGSGLVAPAPPTANTVVRTKTHGMGSMTLDAFRANCNEFTGTFAVPCGDWAALGTTPLTAAGWGDRAGGAVSIVERAATDTSTLWAATTIGRVFISKNADADPASAVTFLRLDSLSTADPDRFATGLTIDPDNANHVWISYSGFNASTPATPGHIFSVTYNPGNGTATWTSLDGSLGDLPLTDVAFDDVGNDLFVSSDFGVLRRQGGTWVEAASGMPAVEVAGLTMVDGKHPGDKFLYAASHGLGAWKLEINN